MDCTVDSLIEEIGHDGSEIWFPHKPEPFNRRAFHPQEIVSVALKLDPQRIIVHIDSDPAVHPNDFRNIKKVYTEQDAYERVHYYLQKYNCVLTGKTLNEQRHAVAWDHKRYMIIDPKVTEYRLNKFIIEDLFILI